MTTSKLRSCVLLFAAFAAGSLFAADKAAKKDEPTNVTVNFTDPDHFTDARSTFGMSTDEYYLKLIKEHIQKTAARQLAAGEKLDVTVTDVDLAGEFLPTRANMDQIRIIKDIFIPRMTLAFKLTKADGVVVKEGERKLSDLNFMNNIGLSGRNEPLYYDKAMLTDWIRNEFKR